MQEKYEFNGVDSQGTSQVTDLFDDRIVGIFGLDAAEKLECMFAFSGFRIAARRILEHERGSEDP